jgi:hypothetical protein
MQPDPERMIDALSADNMLKLYEGGFHDLLNDIDKELSYARHQRLDQLPCCCAGW